MWGLLQSRGFITAPLINSRRQDQASTFSLSCSLFLLASHLIDPTLSLAPGRPGRQGSGNMTARAHVPRHGHRQMPMGCRNMYLTAKAQKGCVMFMFMCMRTHNSKVRAHLLYMVHVCSQKVHNVCQKLLKHLQPLYGRF